MANIENRIVQMQFDNTAFERKMSTTLTSLEKLNTTLANAGKKNGLADISGAVGKFSLGPITAAVDGVSAKFLALSTIAITALSNITARALQSAGQIVKAFALDPVMAGFSEYETNINSIQTILANTSRDGTNLEQVNAALDQLNEYSDKTIYNFSEMARNIGTFTAAGVDLDTSVTAIKGIANLAAISGSSSEQASTAMYQLSQAISNGSVKLMDWNSVVNAGMGGETFQRALFDTGVAMGTITDVPMGTTFDEWTAAGNTFRGSLDSGWLSADVLTTTLGAFSGELTEAQLTAVGFTQEQAQEMMRLGEVGIDAATKVRTFSGLINTVKESIGSGWAQSFRTIFGNFDEATSLFSGLSDTIGAMVSKNADARNAMLESWKGMGGRTKLIENLKNVFKALGDILGPIKAAFRSIFPPATATTLMNITDAIGRFAAAIQPSEETIQNLRMTFIGLFSILKIGWTVIKEGTKFIAGLFKALSGAGNGNFLGFLAKIGEKISAFRRALVDEGGIATFFDGLTEKLKKPLEMFDNLKEKLGGIFKGFKLPTGFSGIFDRIIARFRSLTNVGDRLSGIWDPLKNGLKAITDVLDEVWNAIADWFSSLGGKMADQVAPGDFDATVDAVNVGLLAGIAALLHNFLKNGLKLDFGGGFLDGVKDSLNGLTGTLGAMQTSLKADALMKIAIAIGILAASVLVLSLIDSEDLAKALSAMAIGFGQLMGAFALLNRIGVGTKEAATMNLIATSLILLAGAILILSIAMKIFATMSWEELAKGLVGVAGSLLLLVGAAALLSSMEGSMIAIGIGLAFVAGSLLIMAAAVKIFSLMDWREMAKGLGGIGGALAVMAIGMRLMPKSMILQGAGLVLVAGSLLLLAAAIKIFATMSWEEIGKGLAAVAGGLVIIAGAMQLMPGPMMILTAAALVGVAFSLTLLAGVMKLLGQLSWTEIGKGIAGIAGALIAIGVAMQIAQGGALGAVGLLVMVFALNALIGVFTVFANMSWGDLIHGVVGIAAALGILGVAALLLSPAIGPMLALGGALLVIGAGFALFGLGIAALGKGMQLLAKFGAAGITALVDGLGKLAGAIPDFLSGLAEGVMDTVQTVLEGLPLIIKELGVVIGHILDTLITLIPKAGSFIRTLVSELLQTARSLFPDLVQTGFELITAFLTGIRDNIGPIVTIVADIITNFLDALTLKVPEVIDSVYNFLVAVIEGVIAKAIDIGTKLAPIAQKLIDGLVKGFEDHKADIGAFFARLPGIILGFLSDVGGWLVDKGAELLNGLWNGIQSLWTNVILPWLQDLPGKIKDGIGDLLTTLRNKGSALMSGLWNAAVQLWREVLLPWFKSLPTLIKNGIGDLLTTLRSRGSALMSGLWNAAVDLWRRVLLPWFKSLPTLIKNGIGSLLNTLRTKGADLLNGLWNGLQAIWNNVVKPFFQNIGSKIKSVVPDLLSTLFRKGWDLINGIINGVDSYWENNLKPWFSGMGQKFRNFFPDAINMLKQVGKDIIQGLWNGLQNVWDNVTGWLSSLNPAAHFNDINLAKGHAIKNLVPTGMETMTGLHNGMKEGWKDTTAWLQSLDPSEALQQGFGSRMTQALTDIASQMETMEDFSPIITPVLDLTQVQADAKAITNMFPADVSYSQASNIARSATQSAETLASPDSELTGGVKFEQNIYAPRQLSTGDIYRATRNQIAIAKEELKIP